jgi:hypothetical protein
MTGRYDAETDAERQAWLAHCAEWDAQEGVRRCDGCGRELAPESYAGCAHNRRYCSDRCGRIARSRKEMARVRALPPPTREQVEAVAEECRAALAALRSVSA